VSRRTLGIPDLIAYHFPNLITAAVIGNPENGLLLER